MLIFMILCIPIDVQAQTTICNRKSSVEHIFKDKNTESAKEQNNKNKKEEKPKKKIKWYNLIMIIIVICGAIDVYLSKKSGGNGNE